MYLVQGVPIDYLIQGVAIDVHFSACPNRCALKFVPIKAGIK